MDWLSSGGEIFHRACTGSVGWTPATEAACRGCGAAIPATMRTAAKDQVRARAAAPRRSSEQTRAARKILDALAQASGKS
jgi:hypothetical protein